MIGVYDFCGHYEWTFAWLQAQGGPPLVRQYWDEAIHSDSQRHAAELILRKGIAGMAEYWGHTLNEEGAAFHTTTTEKTFRIDMHDCPSKGFLLRNHLEQFPDYCDHCMGWIGPMLKAAGFVVDHQHNHCGQCWWEIRRQTDPTPPSAPETLAGKNDVRLKPDWNSRPAPTDSYQRATDPDDKSSTKKET
jgi:hypothetical protein